ncbi:DNA-protecting protein DprA [Spirochaetes bacterium]|uniref:DNA-protecting protein DprA n=1 Tax=Candidatus Scatousia excrementipullorum TaxID=2840936 RepID=A0A9D9DM28_9BACT|nr:DNA-protecting protein DprA [Candidatus Scatousia excrementipullorum]
MKNKFWIAFSAIENIDGNFIHRLYNYFGDIEEAFNADMHELSQIDGLSVKKAETFLRERDKIDPDKALYAIENRGIDYVTLEDDNYPRMLKQISDPPAVLYYKGDLFGCNLERTVAVVGSRKSTYHAKEAVNKIISELVGTDICIVSGLAAGIDTSAHNSAIENNLKTIGVIASGFDYIYPTSNKPLYEKIENGKGAVVTEYYPTFQPLKFRFPQRNRIVSGLSYGTLVAEASLKSGALITANLCLEQGRELMCIPGLISNPNTEGIYKLLKNGAALVTKAEDILEALNWEIKPAEQLKMNLSGLTETEAKILDAIEVEEKNADEISLETKIDIDELLTTLTTMELKGIIKQVTGDRYKRV